jgi:aspartokinase/homoserine dehydrogenase 1
MSTPKTHILKFGGSSLQKTDLIRQSAQTVADRLPSARPIVVVSAIGGVTDQLIQLADNPDHELIEQITKRHLNIYDDLLDPDNPGRQKLRGLFDELRVTVDDPTLRKQNQRAWKDKLLSFGERASALIFAQLLTYWDIPADTHEAQHFIKTDSSFGRAQVNLSTTQYRIRKIIGSAKAIPVITGFIGSNDDQQTTTLGRSGSDYTAGLVAGALGADHLEIWTDVNGVLTADPKWVPTAQPIPELSYGDINELSAHGANVIHPQTIRSLQAQNTTVLVKNTHNPTHPGTRISGNFNSNGTLKTITITGPFVRLQIDQPYAETLRGKIQLLSHDNTTGVVEFHQSSSFEPARLLLEKEFFEEVKDQISQWTSEQGIPIDLQTDLYKVKKFSNQFTDNESLTNRIWNLLNANNLQPVESHRNRDERFISFLFNRNDAQRSAQLLNNYLGERDTIIDLFIAGTGEVGKALLKKLTFAAPEGIQFRLLGVCNSRYSLWDEQGLNLHDGLDWAKAKPTNWNQLRQQLTAPNRHNVIFVDATGDEQVARLYADLLEDNIHIVTPSKLANTFEQSYFDKLQALTKKGNTSFRYETTVGAGLPVISTIQNLQQSGDTIHKISGVVSGTMTYLFNQLEKGVSFSNAIVDAREKGYAEPDPRDDLSGEDVARKFLTLARTLGLNIEREELQVESLIPADLRNVSKQTFLERLSDYDQEWSQQIKEAKDNNQTLRYTGRLVDGQITIGIESVPQSSPLGQLSGTDNLIQISSALYNQTPLVIQGAGAGKEVTAGEILGDIIKIAKQLDN